MSASRRPSLLLLLLLLLLAPAALANEVMWQEPLWLQPAGADAPFPALLTLPNGWLLGDAAVVLLPDGDAPDPLRDGLLQALLGADAAVLELDRVPAPGGTSGLPPPAAPDLGSLRPALREALRVLRVEAGAGLLVAIGLGPAGEAALWAAAGSAEGSLAPGLAGAAALGGPGPARFAAGAPPPPAERWDLRAPLLCALLTGQAGEGSAARRCAEALLAPPASLLALYDW